MSDWSSCWRTTLVQLTECVWLKDNPGPTYWVCLIEVLVEGKSWSNCKLLQDFVSACEIFLITECSPGLPNSWLCSVIVRVSEIHVYIIAACRFFYTYYIVRISYFQFYLWHISTYNITERTCLESTRCMY